jgi:restriction system protein
VATNAPTYDQLLNPLLQALHGLGGSGSIKEIYDKVVELQKFPEEVLTKLHDPESGNDTELAYRLAWARTYLKKYGLLENSVRGVWSLTAKAKQITQVDPQEVVKYVKALSTTTTEIDKASEASPPPEIADDQQWRLSLHQILTEKLKPAAFETLVQRLLRESGFIKVEVTGKSGDGGIDGRGIARIHGLMSFHALFQCKRYKGTVSAAEIRDFRGAMVGRADRGLFITTGTFTPAAIKEATRDGAPPIDLLDGVDLADKLKELGLGVLKETVEVVKKVDEEWFASL